MDESKNIVLENSTTENPKHSSTGGVHRRSEVYDDWDLRDASGSTDNVHSKYENYNLTTHSEQTFWNQLPVNNTFGRNDAILEPLSCSPDRLNKSHTTRHLNAISKNTYIRPAFEDNDNLAIEAGSNPATYEQFHVELSGSEVPMHITSFEDLHLCNSLLNNLTKCNYITPTLIQKYALPIIMGGRDMIASAQTGSGKTAAFLLPILYSLMIDPSGLIVDVNHCEPQALILAPTREFSKQICEVATRLSRGTDIKCGILCDGTSTHYQKQTILGGVHIIIATVGRLIDFVNQGIITFSSLRFFVLDEADRMLDMGFQNDIEYILSHNSMVSPAERSTVMFSATSPDNIQQLAKSYLKPDYISVAVREIGRTCKDVIQTVIEVRQFEKKKILITLLRETDDYQGTIVFVGQKTFADIIALYLCEMDFPTTTVHCDQKQPEREKALSDFKMKKIKILVATSVAATGLDVTGVPMVVNMDLPNSIDEYMLRIGCAGRLGNSGKAVSFFDPHRDQEIAFSLVNTLKLADQPVPEWLLKYTDKKASNSINALRNIKGKTVNMTSDVTTGDNTSDTLQPL